VDIVRIHTILHTIETGGPGGAETVMLELASGLDPARFRSLALVPGGRWLPDQLKARNVPLVIAKSPAWYDPALIRAMIRTVREEKVDLIHSHLPDQNFHSCVAGRLTGRKTIATYHGALRLSNTKGLRGAIKTWTVRKSAAAIVVVSDYLRRSFESERFPADRIFRIYNGINLGRFQNGGRGRIRAELGWQENTKIVGVVANLRRSKGFGYFVQAARRIADSIPESRFLVVGEIEDTLAREIKQSLRATHLDGQFSLLGFRSDVPEILNDLDVYVLSSTDEGLSIATIEAMAAGKPVVVTRSGGPQEIVEDGRTGFLVPPADPEALAGKVCEVLLHPELGARLGEAGRKEAEKRFALSTMIGEYEALYEKCLEGS
jgi:glycosyltransferase involved in cell wall biosynthesis